MLELLVGVLIGSCLTTGGFYLTYKRFLTKIVNDAMSKIKIPEDEQVKLLHDATLIKYSLGHDEYTAIMPYHISNILRTIGIKYYFYFGDDKEVEINLMPGQYLIGNTADYGITKIEIYNSFDDTRTLIFDENTENKLIWELICEHLGTM